MVILIAFFVFLTPLGQILQMKLQNGLLFFHPRTKSTNLFVYIAIDDATIDKIRVYPIPRVALAQAVETIKEFEAKAIIIDSEFIDPSPLMVDTALYDQGEKK